MPPKVAPLTKNREAIYDLLTRAKRFHCPISGTWELDAVDLLAAIDRARAAGRAVSLMACLVRATGLVLERFPRLNRHLFHGFFRKYEVEFDSIDCNLVVLREGPGGERVLFPVVIDGANRRPLDEIHATIEHHKQAPLDDLPQIKAVRRLERLPRLLLKYASYRIRSDHRFYRRYFGTYGLSSLVRRGFGPVGGHAVANTGASFFPGTIAERPRVAEGGEVRARTVLPIMLVVDHYLLDGHDMMEAMEYLRDLIERPAALGL